MPKQKNNQVDYRAALMKIKECGTEAYSEELDRSLRRLLFPYILMKLKNREDAEDVLQKTMVKIAYSASAYDPAKSAGGTIAWFKSIAQHTVYDHLRKENRRKKRDPMVTSYLRQEWKSGAYGSDSQPDSRMGGLETQRKQHQNVHTLFENPTLTEGEVQVLYKYHFERRTLRQISDETGVPYNTVKGRHKRGLAKMYKDGPNLLPSDAEKDPRVLLLQLTAA